jgi:hypothetical protein
MYYATRTTDEQRSAIARDLFPHFLTVQVTSDDLKIPERRIFRISVTECGDLQMKEIEIGAP